MMWRPYDQWMACSCVYHCLHPSAVILLVLPSSMVSSIHSPMVCIMAIIPVHTGCFCCSPLQLMITMKFLLFISCEPRQIAQEVSALPTHFNAKLDYRHFLTSCTSKMYHLMQATVIFPCPSPDTPPQLWSVVWACFDVQFHLLFTFTWDFLQLKPDFARNYSPKASGNNQAQLDIYQSFPGVYNGDVFI